jgi:hypothetical protein
VLREELKIDRSDAIKRVLRSFMLKQGIDLGVRTQLRWLAIELLDCLQLTRALAHGTEPPSAPQPAEPPVETHDPQARLAASKLLAARQLTIEWNDPRPTTLSITRTDQGWTAAIRDSLNSATLAVKPAVESFRVFLLDGMTKCAIAPAELGTEDRLHDLQSIVIELIPGRKLLPQGVVNVRLDYMTSHFFKNVLGKVSWV